MSKLIHKHLLKLSSEHCKPLEVIIKSNGVINIDVPKDLELFDCLAQTVSEQQLSYKAAKNIWSKVNSSSQKRKLNLIDYFDSKYINSIRKDGLSKNKIKAIIGAKKAVLEQKITIEKLSSESTGWNLFPCSQFFCHFFSIENGSYFSFCIYYILCSFVVF